MTENKVDKKTARFLIGSFIGLIVFSVIVFISMALYMSRIGDKTINAVGNIYMKGISDQVSAHFQTLINAKFDQVENTVKVVDSDTDDREALYEELIYRVQVRDFEYLALCSEEMELQMLYGEQVELTDPDPFFASLKRNERKVAVGKDAQGLDIVLFAVQADYPMEDGRPSKAMVVALPITYISNVLDAEEDTLVQSHIIRKDGSLVVRDSAISAPDFFSKLYENCESGETEQIAQCIRRLSDTMEQGNNYSAIFEMNGVRHQMYSTLLADSEWYLVTVLPYGELDEIVNMLSDRQAKAIVLAFTVICIVLLMIFYRYFQLIRAQMEELKESREIAMQATKAKSEFLSNMSHDIRTPMNAIVGMTAIATAHIDDKEQVQNCLKKIAASGKHLLGLINDVLDMSKIESGKMTLSMDQVSLSEVIEAIVGIVQPQIRVKQQSFDVHVDKVEVEDVYCDSVRLNQVLLNLLSNAVKYTQEGGHIRLSLYEEESPKGKDYIRTHIEVEDNGIGMSDEFLHKIFESYSRADSKRVHRTEGAGLGMAITKYIVDAMEGTIDVQSELGQGTKFHLILDFEKSYEKESDMVLPAWKMLVVDDDEMLCRTTAETLASIGINADWTLSGEKAIAMVNEQHQKRDDYQIVLLDWKLPEMDGIQVARKIRHDLGSDIPILLISAYDWSEFETEAREAGITGFISKPLFKSTLFYGLKKHMCVAEETQEEQQEQEIDLSGRRILVAEDNEINWEILKELLSDVGLELEWAENGKICVDKFSQAEEKYYDAILMDVRMPEMTGYEATKAIRAMARPDAQTVPIIAMTADAFSEDVQRCLECGMNAHTSKPVNMEEVLFLLKNYLSVK